MQQVSTNLTLALKIFLPTFWLAFFGLFGIFVWFFNYESFGSLSADTFRIVYTGFFIGFAAFLFFTVGKLKRVEMDSEGIYATNYFKHYRYPWENVEGIKEAAFPFVRVVTVILKQPGKFGKKIHFIPSKKRFQLFLVANPKVSEQLLEKEVSQA